ncbi:hypothetical protein G5B30_03220 [Sphingobacterium sp. SGG-5]|uniref:hypothetical protein n=1 Tax=Sphingobacterium sp. SGG-5 TaxID=2710881 RepID=UPI0013EDD226|nr:hypothetical protein [Sphingobacterium sp. SGG-5]NGM60922.1 hypothetical protein [Sphingobacterium sp. SGG-5]
MKVYIFLRLCLLMLVTFVCLETHAQKRSAGGKRYTGLIDIPHQILRYHTVDSIRKEMRILKELGFERVYLVLCNPGYPAHSHPFNTILPMGKKMPYRMLESVIELGDPNWVYLNEAKKAGLEAFAVMKPYESGSGNTIPEGKVAPYSRALVKTIGGSHIHFDNMLIKHPEYRVQRKPLVDSIQKRTNLPVTAVEVSFCIDSFRNKIGHNNYLNFRGYSRSEVDSTEVELYVSKDNGTYKRLEQPYTTTVSYGFKDVYDANGRRLYDNKEHLVLRLENLDISEDYKYFVAIVKSQHKLYTIPYSMIKVFTASGEIPITLGVYARNPLHLPNVPLDPATKAWGTEGNPVKGEKAMDLFQKWGVEFEWYGVGFWGNGWESTGVYGIAKGVREEMKGTLCEAYPEVREYWMQQVRRAVDMGYDGIDFRLQNHSAMVADHLSYGYNEPIVEKYLQKYGVNILQQEADPYKIMKIRGDFYYEFLEEAAKYIRDHHKKINIHLRHADQEPEVSYAESDFNELGFWTMPKIIVPWEKIVDLADEITLKHYYFNDYRPALADRIKARAKAQHKPVWVIDNVNHRELNAKFMTAIEQDPLVDGVVFYEFAPGVFDTYVTGDTSKPYSLVILQDLLKQVGWPSN